MDPERRAASSAAEAFDRCSSARMACRSLGAAVENLSHRSLRCVRDNSTSSHAGSKQLDQLHAFAAQMIREKLELVAAGSIGAPDQNQ